MEAGLSKEEIVRIIKRELPAILRDDPELREELREMLRSYFAPREDTEDRFERILREMQKEREANRERFEESDRKFNTLWEEVKELREDTRRRFEENDRKFNALWEEVKELREDTRRRFEEYDKRFAENDRKFNALWDEVRKQREESDRRFNELLKEIRRVDRRIDRTIGAFGARWGISAEHAFREAISSVLEELTGYKVDRYLAYDSEGKVFGRPDQVELDLVIKDGLVWVMEIKSSVSKADAYIFLRKVEFYSDKEGKEVGRRIIVSPMIEPSARKVIEELGIEAFSSPEEIPESNSGSNL